MSYVVRCNDLTVMIDGGCDGKDPEQLTEYLRKITGEQKPVIDAWFLTHAHPDHIFCLKGIADRFSDCISVKKIIAPFPGDDVLAVSEPPTVAQLRDFRSSLKKLDVGEWVEPSAGDVFVFGDAVFEILFTWKDLCPEALMRRYSVNDTSTVFRLTAEGQSVLFLGDASEGADRVLLSKYGKSLKSDVVQLAHHGCYGSNIETYRAIDPEIVLWPSPVSQVMEMCYIVTVDRLLVREPLRIKDFIIHGDGTRALEMPIRPSVAPREIKQYFPDEALLTSPSGKIPFLSDCPDPSDPDDPRWEAAARYSFESFKGTPDGESASLSLCASERGVLLRVRADGMADGVPCASEFSAVSDCCCVRLHYSEKHVGNFDRNWGSEFSVSEFRDLRLYPDEKLIGGALALNSMPGVFDSAGRVYAEGFAVSMMIPFGFCHGAGDLVGLHAEVNFSRAPGGPRTLKLMLNGEPYPERYRIYPGGVKWFTLV